MRQSKFVPLKEYIEQCTERNTEGLCGVEDAVGVNIEKQMGPMKAKIDPEKIYDFFMVKPGYFVFNQRGSRKLGIGLNFTNKTLITTYDHVVFKVKDKCKDVLDATFLYILLSRKEFDRYAEYSSWGSSTEYFRWRNMCEVVIPLPSIDEQRKVVNAWKALRELKEQNEAIYAPAMQVCQSYIQELKHKYKSVEIGQYIDICDEKNTMDKKLPVVGINIEKTFMPTAANVEGVNLKNYKIMKKGRFVFSGMQTGRDQCIRTGLYKYENEALVSPAYTTYTVDEKKGLLSQYLDLLFRRKEMDRLGAFYSDASVRANLEWYRFLQIKIPLPPLSIQQAIVKLYNCANEAKKIAEEADRKSREICPALIQYVINK